MSYYLKWTSVQNTSRNFAPWRTHQLLIYHSNGCHIFYPPLWWDEMIIMYQQRIQSSIHNVLTCLMITQNALQLNFDIVLESLHLVNNKIKPV